MSNKTAGIIIIGDEILKGQVQDSNVQYIAKHLHELGVKMERVIVIPDDSATIAKEVLQFSRQYTYVITSGGIGTTHDDVTYEGVAKAFNQKLVLHPEMLLLVKKFFHAENPNAPSLKLAKVPTSTKLHYGVDPATGERNWMPIVSVENVFIFPGIPHFLKKAFKLLKNDLFGNQLCRFHVDKLFLNLDEVTLTPFLNAAVAKHKQVTFGSYPEIFHSYYKVRITLESQDENAVREAKEDLFRSLPTGTVVKYDDKPLKNATEKLTRVSDDEGLQLRKPLEEASQIVTKCYTDYKPEEVILSFNGGKDCTVVLHLCYLICKQLHPRHKVQAFYIKDLQAFRQVDDFIKESTERYKLDMIPLHGSMKQALESLKIQYPQLKVALMGTRISDPHSGNAAAFSATDADWPAFIRASPILNWDYHKVWKLITALSLPYCSLYDQGYTSIGSVNDTAPNQLLQYEDEWGRVRYHAAHMLKDATAERKGRRLKGML